MDKSGNMSMCSWETKMFDTRADLPLPYLLPLRFRLSPPSPVGDPVRPSDISAPRNTAFRLLGQRQRVIRQHRRVLMHLRSEEHTSELQSPCNLVCRLLLEKKKRTYGLLGDAQPVGGRACDGYGSSRAWRRS